MVRLQNQDSGYKETYALTSSPNLKISLLLAAKTAKLWRGRQSTMRRSRSGLVSLLKLYIHLVIHKIVSAGLWRMVMSG